MELDGKVSVITGAGRGLGKEIAKKLAQEGSFVILLSKTKEHLDDSLNEIKNLGFNAISFQCDISDYSQVEKTFHKISKDFPKIDIIVNNAAILQPIGPFLKTDLSDWKKSFQTNLFGAVHILKNVLPIMEKNNSGKIINISGGGAFNPFPNFSAYAVSKSALIRLTETLAKEYEDYDISFNSVSPGTMKTQMTQLVIENPNLSGNEFFKAKKTMETGGSSLQKILDLILFLASNRSNGLSGKSISAQWDDLSYIKKNIDLIQNSNLYTLARVIDGEIK
jgi:NAD(P)-dependent dehydrogenase (short-subunit alcohol dehydrogenase family)